MTEYRLQLASDVTEGHDGLGLELYSEVSRKPIATVFRDDERAMVYLECEKGFRLPLETVDWFIGEARRRLG